MNKERSNNDTKKKILIADVFEAIGGEEEVAYYLYSNIDREKYSVYITGEECARYFDKNSPQKEEWIKCVVKGKFRIIKMLHLRKLIKNYEIDLINVHGYSAGFFVRLACFRMKKVKIVWTMHLCVDDMFSDKIINKYINTCIENILNHHKSFTDKIVCVNNDSMERLMQRGTSVVPICTIYNGIDISKFTPKSYINNEISKPLICGFISRFSEQKGIPYLLSAIKELLEEGYQIQLKMIGEGPLYHYVEEYILEHKLSDKIELLGYQKHIEEIMGTIDVLILPSLYECFPMIILEALSCEVPVIASKVNGVPEIIEDNKNGFLIESGNISELKVKIVNYFNNRTLLRIHGKNGRDKIIDSFTKEKMVKSYEKLYDNLLADYEIEHMR